MCHGECGSLMGWSALPGRYRWAHLTFAPPCMTVDGKTYGGAGGGVVCAPAGGGPCRAACDWRLATSPGGGSHWLRAGTCGAMLWGSVNPGSVRTHPHTHTVRLTLTPNTLYTLRLLGQWLTEPTRWKTGKRGG